MKRILLILAATALSFSCFGCQVIHDPVVHAVWIDADTTATYENYKTFPVIIHPEDFIFSYGDSFKSIESIGFQMWVQNSGSSSAGFTILADSEVDTTYTSRDDVMANTLPVFDSPVIQPGQGFYVDWVGSMKYIINRVAFYNYVLDSEFSLYFVPDSPEDTIVLDSIVVIITARI